MPQQEWDENGNPIKTLADRTPVEWDENGKPITPNTHPTEAQQVAAGLPPVPRSRPNVQPNNLMDRMTGKPLTGMESGLSSPAQTPENADAMATGAAIGAPIEGVAAGGARAIPALVRGGIGSAATGYGMGMVGKMFGPKGEQIGRGIGGVIGGLAGGGEGWKGSWKPGDPTFMDRIYGLEPKPAPTPPVENPFPGAVTSKAPGGASLQLPPAGEAKPWPVYKPPPPPEPTVGKVATGPGPYRGPSSVPKSPTPEKPLVSRIPTGPNSMPKPQVGSVSTAPGGYRGPASVPKPAPEPQPLAPAFPGASSSANPQWNGPLPEATTPQQPFRLIDRVTANAQTPAAPDGGSIDAGVTRNIAEKAAMGHELSPEEEAILAQHVQSTYSPETGMDPASSKAGKMYASRGTQFRPTNSQLANRVQPNTLSNRIQPSPEEEDVMERARGGQQQEEHDQ